MIASQLIDNGYHNSLNMVGAIQTDSPHSLTGVVRRFLGEELTPDKKRIRESFIGKDPESEFSEEQIDYAAGDTKYLEPLYLAQQVLINQRGLTKIQKLEDALTPVLVKMEARGCLIDKAKHRDNIKNWEKSKKDIEDKLDEEIIRLAKQYPTLQGGKFTNSRRREEVLQLDLFGGEGYLVKNLNIYNVNFSSPRQIENLFDRVGAAKPTDDTGKISFGENPIKTYLNINPNSPLCEFLRILLQYREYDKLLGTYGSKLFDVLYKGRIRTNYGQVWTDTGRLNSAEIIKGELGANIANIPKRADIRSIFVPDPAYSFVDCDQSGQEVAIAADFSKEPVLLKALKDGFDHHSFLGSISYSIIFNRKFELKNTSEEFVEGGFTYKHSDLRQEHKSCLFAMFYGGGAMRVQNVLNQYLVNHWPPEKRFEKAQEIATALKRALPVLTSYLKKQVDLCKKQGYVVANKLGFRRYFDDPEKAYGEIMNFSIQSTGAASIKIALINIDKWFEDKSKELGISEEELGWIVFTVYDQNLCCLNDRYIKYAPEIQKIMGDSLTYFLKEIKGSSDMKIKKHWSK